MGYPSPTQRQQRVMRSLSALFFLHRTELQTHGGDWVTRSRCGDIAPHYGERLVGCIERNQWGRSEDAAGQLIHLF